MLPTAGVGAAMFHLTTHAFFKALMFLGSGSVIHGCHHEQDIFKMGGLRKKMPVTFYTFTIGVLAIIGMPGLAGFFSKDAILYLAMEKNTAVFAILAFTAVLTAFYMVRMWKITFWGEARSDDASHAHESGLSMTLPLLLLAALSVAGGYSGVFGKLAGSIANHIPEAEGSAHTTILIVSLAVMLVGARARRGSSTRRPRPTRSKRSPAACLARWNGSRNPSTGSTTITSRKSSSGSRCC